MEVEGQRWSRTDRWRSTRGMELDLLEWIMEPPTCCHVDLDFGGWRLVIVRKEAKEEEEEDYIGPLKSDTYSLYRDAYGHSEIIRTFPGPFPFSFANTINMMVIQPFECYM